MPNVRSIWKLTYDPEGTPVVLLDFDDKLAAEIRWPSQRGAEEAPLVDSVAPFLRDSGNRAVRVSFDRIEQETDYPATAKAVMTRLISHGGMAKRPLKIEAAGVAECYWLAGQCLVPVLDPGIHVKGSPEMATRYSLVFTSIAQVDTEEDTLEIPEPVPTDPGTFAPGAAAPGDPGLFPAPAPVPTDPGGFGGAYPSPGMLVGGTLSPDARGFLPEIADDMAGKPQWGIGDAATVFPTILLGWQTTSGTAGRWLLVYYPSVSGGSAWRSGIAEFAVQPTPDLATGWVTAGAIAAGAVPTGTPTITAV